MMRWGSLMVGTTNSPSVLGTDEAGGWRFRHWRSPRIVAGVTDRHVEPSTVLHALRADGHTVDADQVHGSSLAAIGRHRQPIQRIPGCDALLTETVGPALLIRTADCLPIFFTHSLRGVVGIAHAGWRGLAARLPARVIAAFRHLYQCRAEELEVAIGPAIHACCYEVGPEFAGRFGRFVREHDGRRTCDLIGVAMDQLRASGVRADRLVESARCTACEPDHWYSVRREGDATGRLTSFIMLRS